MNGCYPTPVNRPTGRAGPPAFAPADGLDAELGYLVAEIKAGRPVPLGLAVKTFGTAVATVYVVTLALEAVGVVGRLPVAIAAVLAPIAYEVLRKKRP